MRKLRIILILLTVMSLATGCSSTSPQLQAIKDRGILRVGIKIDVPNFGYINPDTNLFEGMEVDIAHAITKDILGNEKYVKLVPVTPQTRSTMLENGEIDMAIATFTITEERKKAFNFSHPYYTDEIGLLVQKSSGITGIEQLDGKKVGVAAASTSGDELLKECQKSGVSAELVTFSSYPEIKAALAAGEVDAFCVDKSILIGYLDDSTMILDRGFKPQEYGIATNIKNDKIAEYVDNLLKKMQQDGSLNAIIEKWGMKK